MGWQFLDLQWKVADRLSASSRPGQAAALGRNSLACWDDLFAQSIPFLNESDGGGCACGEDLVFPPRFNFSPHQKPERPWQHLFALLKPVPKTIQSLPGYLPVLTR